MNHTPVLFLSYRRYRSAIALNNIGVRLLERQCHEQAVDSLEHANLLMRAVSSLSTTTTDGIDNCCGEDHVNQSVHHLCHSKPGKVAPVIMEVLTTTPDGFLVQGELSTPDAFILDCVLEDVPSSHLAFPIRIEDVSDTLEASLLKRQAAIMLHNLVIASLCSCKRTTTVMNTTFVREFSIFSVEKRVFQVLLYLAKKSCFTFMQQLSELQVESPTSCQRQRDTAIELASLIMAVLNSIIQIQQECSLHDQAWDSYIFLMKLRSFSANQQERQQGNFSTMLFVANTNDDTATTTTNVGASAAAA